ncbi:MAG: hypothetical protein V2A77_02155 [Pseudomonadota bacterium]
MRSVVLAEEMTDLALEVPGHYREWDRDRLREEMWQDIQTGQFITVRGVGDRLLGFATFWRVSRELAEELVKEWFRPPTEHLRVGPVGVLQNICSRSPAVTKWLIEALKNSNPDVERIIARRNGKRLVVLRRGQHGRRQLEKADTEHRPELRRIQPQAVHRVGIRRRDRKGAGSPGAPELQQALRVA